MASIQIIITPDADDDIRGIYDYLSNYSMNAALGQIDVLLEKFELLKQFPRLGKTIGTLNNERLREFYVGKYRIAYYIVSDNQIDILRIHHTSRPPGFE